MSLGRDVIRARGLSPADRRLLIEAIGWLGLLRVAVLMLPYRRLASLLELTQSDPSEVLLVSCAGQGAQAEAIDARTNCQPAGAR